MRLAVVTLSSATSSSISSASGRTLPAQDNTSVQPIDIYSVLDERCCILWDFSAALRSSTNPSINRVTKHATGVFSAVV